MIHQPYRTEADLEAEITELRLENERLRHDLFTARGDRERLESEMSALVSSVLDATSPIPTRT